MAFALAGRRVLVLGGGDTAMDCVRSAVRLGAAQVTCAYRRSEADMPGSAREVKYARAEGVQFLFHRQPLAIEGDTAVTGVRLAATRAGSGRAGSLELVPGSEESIAADVVIQSFGFRASPAAWWSGLGIELDARGHVATRGPAGATSHPKVFAGGDNVRGADLVVTAVFDGREAGNAIARKLELAPLSSR